VTEIAREAYTSAGKVEVTVRFGGTEKAITGTVDEVIRELLLFFSKIYPQLELIRRVSLSVDLEDFLKASEGIIAITPEGMAVTADTNRLKDKELIMLHLAKTKVGHMLGKCERDALRLSDLVVAAKSKTGTVAGRLSEMCSEGIVERLAKGEYRATTSGLHYFIKNIAPKLKSSEGGTSS
jgi:hypothetical protein